MNILFVNNDGGGFADYLDILPGMTVANFSNAKWPRQAENYLIRVDGRPAARDQVLF